jgi:hypothetical protein
MPKYRITGPDGGTYEVTAPEGATQEQVLAYAQQNYKPQVGRSGITREQRQADIARMDAERAQRDAPILSQMGRGRAANITGRSMLEGLAAIPDMFVAPLTDLVNRAGEKPRNLNSLITGEPERYFPKQMNLTQGVNYLADLLGGEQVRPETGGERVLADTTRGLTGAVIPVGAGRQMAQSGNQVVNRIGQLLQQQPVAQIAGGGLSGAAQGATREAGGGTGAQLTAGFLGALAPFGPGALVRPNSTMVERSAARQIQSEAADPRALMNAAPSRVPGVQRTLAEETLDPGVARMERQVRGRTSEFVPLDSANNAARVAQLQRIAGTEADMAAAIEARSLATTRARDTAMRSGEIPVPATVKAVNEAIKSQRGRPAIESGLETIRGLLPEGGIDPVTNLPITPADEITVLDNIRKTIGDMLEGRYGGDNASSLQGSRELLELRNSLNSEISEQVPAFGEYLSAYRSGSGPINRMEVGRELISRGSGSVADPTTGLRPLLPASLSRQAVDLDALAQRATGFDKARASDILTPDDISAIRAIQDDLERQNFRATAGSGGNSMTAERQALGERLGRSALEAIPVVGSFAERLRMLNQPRIDAAIAQLIANPVEARRVLESMAPRDRQVITKAMIQMSAARPKER